MKYYPIPWIALGLSIMVTTIVWFTVLDLERQTQEVEFRSLTQKITSQILDQLQRHEQLLLGFKGLFNASIEVEPEEFRRFFTIQKIIERFPDSQGIGFIEYVNGEDEKNRLKSKMGNYGLNFTVYPEGEREKYFPVVFLEPLDVRNKRAIGYDVYTQETRRHAVDQAIKSGQTTLTNKIILVQEIDENTQNGFLMLLPIYQNIENDKNQELRGLIYSVFRMDDFIEGTLDKEIFDHINIRIYDGPRELSNLFFESSYADPLNFTSFTDSSFIEFGGKFWTLEFHGILPAKSNIQDKWMIIPVIGYIMSFLLFFTFLLFTKNIHLTNLILKQEKIRTIGELASRFSHDIRNPLSNIQMTVELIRKNKEIKQNQHLQDKLQIIAKNVDRINHQVNEVLDFVRPQPIDKKKISLLSCIEESITSMKIPKNIEIKIPKEDVSIYGDYLGLQVVCKNLILNSIQAIDNQEGVINIKFKEDQKYDIIEIEDSGTGLPEGKISSIFEPLTTTKQHGVGLGLVSCKNIIENHGGIIEVKINPTRFIVKIPKN